MVVLSILFTSLFYIITKKTSILFKISFIIFVIISILKLSTTLLAGIIFTSFIFLFVETKRMGNVLFYLLVFTNLFCSTILLSDDTCKSKLIPKYNNEYYLNILIERLTALSIVILKAIYASKGKPCHFVQCLKYLMKDSASRSAQSLT